MDWSIFEAVDAVIDAPIPSLYLELLDRFPNSKVGRRTGGMGPRCDVPLLVIRKYNYVAA